MNSLSIVEISIGVLLCLLVCNFLILMLLFYNLYYIVIYMCGLLVILLNSCGYFGCLLFVVFVVTDGFFFWVTS